MNLRSTLAPLLALCALLAPGAVARGSASRPNVVFLFSDDHRADTIRALGNRHIQTPNLDALVRDGTAFSRAYIMGGMQGAVCVPSRAMMLSGRSLFRVPENLAEITTWPTVLREAGYRTFATGKWHNGAKSVAVSFPEARSIFLGGMNDHWRVPVQDVTNGVVGARRVAAKHSSELFADEAIAFLKAQRNADQPFALYVAFTAPHDPRQAPTEFTQLYASKPPPLPKNFLPTHPFDNGELNVRDEKLEAQPRTPEAVRRHLADYYAMISHLDAQIGRILDTLDETGQTPRSIVVFAGDNGLAIGSHGLMGKQNVYEHSMRVPLILRGPGIPKGKRFDAMCYSFDLFPTLCELTGIDTPASVEGRSLVPLLNGRAKRHRDFIFTAYRQVQRAVRDERWKLISYPAIGRHQLFDLKSDPHELNDVSSDAQFAARLERMKSLLANAQREFTDPSRKNVE